MLSSDNLAEILKLDHLPRSQKYDHAWMIENSMGPNAVWLTESLTQVMEPRSGMRVLDMGCGRAMSSIFLAKEFGVHVWATDLWVKPTDNWKRVQAQGLENFVFPIAAEAHTLPFAQNFFDAVVSVDAYHYFGTDDLYLSYFAKFVKPGSQIGIVMPGLVQELGDTLPEHLGSNWDIGWSSFHSPQWWRRHWEHSGAVDVSLADLIPDGWKLWLKWCEYGHLPGFVGTEAGRLETDRIRTDAGRTIGFTRIVAQKRQ